MDHDVHAFIVVELALIHLTEGHDAQSIFGQGHKVLCLGNEDALDGLFPESETLMLVNHVAMLEHVHHDQVNGVGVPLFVADYELFALHPILPVDRHHHVCHLVAVLPNKEKLDFGRIVYFYCEDVEP